ncbi:MAG: hypothetical protein JWP30_2054 [Homoserinimonas sp.]|nr:hypothetical protein [Homoserinimonas sp.]
MTVTFDDYNEPPRKPKKWGRSVIVTVLVIAMFVGGAAVADAAARDFAETRVESEVASEVPGDNGNVTATIGGFSFLQQYLQGTLDRVDVTLDMDEVGMGELMATEDAPVTPRIVDGGTFVDGQIDVLGNAIGYTVALEPSLDGEFLVLTPTGLEVTTADVSADIGQFVDLASFTRRVCTAELLPAGINLQDVSVSGNKLQLTLTGRDLPLDLKSLATKGSCD